MNTFTLTAILTFLVTASSAQTAVNEASFTLTGDAGDGVYPSYNLTVPEDGSSVPIDNSLVVVSIEPEPESADYNCTFFGAEGSVTYTIDGTVDVDPPQAQVSVTCAPAH